VCERKEHHLHRRTDGLTGYKRAVAQDVFQRQAVVAATSTGRPAEQEYAIRHRTSLHKSRIRRYFSIQSSTVPNPVFSMKRRAQREEVAMAANAAWQSDELS
jgi:hypothetical protein